jgi:CRISPR-associated Csx2 family protein
MATVVIGFIGVGRLTERRDGSSHGSYQKADYFFPAEGAYPESRHSTSLFGAALLSRLRELNRPVARWVVMGTSQSMWDALTEALPEPDDALADDAFASAWERVGEAVKGGSVTQALLDEWQALLTGKMSSAQCLCQLVGAADSVESQQRIWAALAESVKEGDEIVLDITNGFRHQPVLTGFMVMLLRWLRDVKRVDIYNGAFELKGKVLRLPLCNDLLQATEAVAIFNQTGNYAPLGACLNLSANFSDRLRKVVFADETNQPEKGVATQLRNELATQAGRFDPVQSSLATRLSEALGWAAESSLARILRRKARFAFGHAQYLKAIALLWEAILVAGCERYHIADPMDYDSRDEARDQLIRNLMGSDYNLFKNVEYLRHAMIHGTSDRRNREVVRQALGSLQEFQLIFEQGDELLDRLLT